LFFLFIYNLVFLYFIANINCLHADGEKFIHPLQHLGKTKKDLPLLVIDSFKHMFLFPDFKQIS
jgi:endoplasmic reticulum resident protein 44